MWSKSRLEKYFRTKIVRILVCHDVPSHPYGKLRPPLKLNFLLWLRCHMKQFLNILWTLTSFFSSSGENNLEKWLLHSSTSCEVYYWKLEIPMWVSSTSSHASHVYVDKSTHPCSSVLLVREECSSISAVWHNIWRHPLVSILPSLSSHAL